MINFVKNYSWNTTQKQITSLDLDMYRKIILKHVLRKQGMLICTGFKWHRIGCTDGFVKQCEILCSDYRVPATPKVYFTGVRPC